MKYRVIVDLSNGMQYEAIFKGEDSLVTIWQWYSNLEKENGKMTDLKVKPYE